MQKYIEKKYHNLGYILSIPILFQILIAYHNKNSKQNIILKQPLKTLNIEAWKQALPLVLLEADGHHFRRLRKD